jgi:hypothetical protein
MLLLRRPCVRLRMGAAGSIDRNRQTRPAGRSGGGDDATAAPPRHAHRPVGLLMACRIACFVLSPELLLLISPGV